MRFYFRAVFLCTTGAEALYSDLGHCGYKNIRVSWVFVKIMLILNYLGQGAWLLNNYGMVFTGTNPFFGMLPHYLIIPAVILATATAIIASQALITGSFTIFSEAMSLNFLAVPTDSISFWFKRSNVYSKNQLGFTYFLSNCSILFQRIRTYGSSVWFIYYGYHDDDYHFINCMVMEK